jgi:sterol desaturase/sphingolipid hydroxylase (fatty acid hydroxylase superfamily)
MGSLVNWYRSIPWTQLANLKGNAKVWAYAHHLGYLWDTSRERVLPYLLDYKVWTLGLIPCLLLESIFPAVMDNDARRASRWMDFCYPIFGGLTLFPFVSILVNGLQQLYQDHIPFLNTRLLDGAPLLVQFACALVVTDLMSYVAHYLRHKVRWLWFFHTIHHSQENLNPLTVYRVHAFEAVINTAIRTIPMAFVGGSAERWVWFIELDIVWHCFIHANVRTNLGPLGRIVVSPQFHRIHHSSLPDHFDKNYGERLMLWDWLFGTMHPDTSTYPPTGVNGLEPWSVERASSFRGLATAWAGQVAYPFVKIGQSILQLTRRKTSSLSQPPEAPSPPVPSDRFG